MITICIESDWYGKFNNARIAMEDKILPVTEKWTETVHDFSDDIITNFDKLKNNRLTFSKRKEFTDNLLHDFGIDKQGNTIDSDKVNTITSWVEELYDAYDKDFSNFMKKLTDGKFIYYWGHTPDIDDAKTAIDATFALTVIDTFATVGIITPHAIGFLKAVYDAATRVVDWGEIAEDGVAEEDAVWGDLAADIAEDEQTVASELESVSLDVAPADEVAVEIDNPLFDAAIDVDPFEEAEVDGYSESTTVLSGYLQQDNNLGSAAGLAIVVGATAVVSLIDLIVSYIAVLNSK